MQRGDVRKNVEMNRPESGLQRQDLDTILKYIENGEGDTRQIFSKGGMLANIGKDIPSHQLRKFYSELLTINDILSIDRSLNKLNDEELKKLKVRLAMLEPLAYYTKSRIDKGYSQQFSEIVDIMSNSIKKINDSKNINDWEDKFYRFKQIFEVIIAYSKSK